MNTEAIKQLWEAVSRDYEVGTIEEFTAYLSDERKRGLFFEEVVKPTYNVDTLEDFEAAYGLKKKTILNLLLQKSSWNPILQWSKILDLRIFLRKKLTLR